MIKDSEEKTEPHYWSPMTRDELNWVMDRIKVGDTAWLCRAMSAHMRHIWEETSRREGRSLVLQRTLNSEGKHEEELAEWDKIHAPDSPWSNGGHEETDSLDGIDSGHGSCPGTDKLRGPEGIA